ncbi:hypothetical protein L7F22_063843 [Adiantum nelumboides]|nr:hypothetical protein [Adiantum nelumboides]
MERYQKLEKVGEGTYGKVYKARDARLVVLKTTRRDQDEEGVPSTTLREVSLLQMLSHSIYVNNKPILYLVFEYLDSDLKRFIDNHSNAAIPMSNIKRLMYQLCKGISYCHSHGVMHRDLKPQKLLLDKKGLLKIGDLGLSRSFSILLKSYTHEVVTLWYRAPEVLLGATITQLQWMYGPLDAFLVVLLITITRKY